MKDNSSFQELIEKDHIVGEKIIRILQEEKITLAHAKSIFSEILKNIEENNIINLL